MRATQYATTINGLIIMLGMLGMLQTLAAPRVRAAEEPPPPPVNVEKIVAACLAYAQAGPSSGGPDQPDASLPTAVDPSREDYNRSLEAELERLTQVLQAELQSHDGGREFRALEQLQSSSEYRDCTATGPSAAVSACEEVSRSTALAFSPIAREEVLARTATEALGFPHRLWMQASCLKAHAGMSPELSALAARLSRRGVFAHARTQALHEVFRKSLTKLAELQAEEMRVQNESCVQRGAKLDQAVACRVSRGLRHYQEILPEQARTGMRDQEAALADQRKRVGEYLDPAQAEL